jgi:ubiquinone/menaquinone biosynthesis C-methylase UbiE
VVWFYDFWSWLTESKAAKKVVELAEIRGEQTILEIACGTGVVFEQIVAKNTNGHNIGVDLSPAMLRKAKQRMNNHRAQNYELKEGNVLDLNIQDASIDTLLNNFMIDLMPEETFDKIASEFYRVLKSNGVAVISVFSFGENRLNRFWYWVAKKMPDLLTGCRPVSIKKNLTNAGFEIEYEVQISQNTFPSEVIKARKPV